MQKITKQRGITFYRLLSSFFITTFLCAIIIIAQYIHFLSRQEEQLQKSYRQMTDTVFSNLSSIVLQFEQFGDSINEVRDLSLYEEVIQAEEFSKGQPKAFELWELFSHVYNSEMSGPGNVSYLYLKNSDCTLGLGSFESSQVSIEEIQQNLGLSPAAWKDLLKADDTLLTAFEKTDTMTYGRLMLAREIYPDLVLITGIAEDNIQKAVKSCYLPPETTVSFTAQNNQSIRFSTSSNGDWTEAVYPQDSMKQTPGSSGDTYEYSESLCEGSITAHAEILSDYHSRMFRSVLLSVILALGIWLLLGGGLSYLLTKKLYHPVEKLLADLPKKSESGRTFSEFGLVQKTLQSLTDRNQTYEQQLQWKNKHLAYHLWMRTLRGELPVTAETVSILEAGGFPVEGPPYLLIQMTVMPPLQREAEEDPVFLQDSAIWRELPEYVCAWFQKSNASSYFTGDRDCITGLVRPASADAESLSVLLTQLKEAIQNDFPVQIGIFASSFYQLLADLPTAYAEVSDLAEYNILMDDYDSVCISSTGGGASLDSALSVENRNLTSIHKLSACIQYSQFADALILLNQIFSRLPAPSPERLLESIREICYLLDTIILSLDPVEYGDAVSRLTIDRQSLRKKSLKDLSVYLTDFLTDLQKQKEKQSSPHQKIAQVREYLDTHYHDCNLSAQSVAQQFHISVPWLSTVFKKETNEGFLEYIHKLRISKAQELILSTDLSLKEISERAGYSNYLTMSRAFKRYTGVTPKWYRTHTEGAVG